MNLAINLKRQPITLIPWPDEIVLPGKLYRFYCPSSENDFRIIVENKITCVITALDDENLIKTIQNKLQDLSIIHLVVKTQNFKTPDEDQLQKCISVAVEHLKRGENILIHCGAGQGRTGTIMACLLSELTQLSAKRSISYLRNFYRAVENKKQEEFVAKWVEKNCKK